MAGGVGEAGHGAGGIGRRAVGDRERGATRPEAQGEITRLQAQAQRGRHVVARAGCHRDPGAAPLTGDSVRGEDLGQRGAPVDVVAHQPEKIVSVAALARRPVPRPRGIAPVGGPPAGQPVGEPVVREQDGGDAPERLGLVAAQPVQLGDGEGRDGDTAAGLGPGGRPARQGVQQHGGVGRRLRVVPQLGRAQDLAVVSEDDQPMLLRGDRQRARRLTARDGGFGTGGVERVLPRRGVLLAAGRGRGRVRGPARRHDGAGIDIAHFHLAGRRGRVDPDHQRH